LDVWPASLPFNILFYCNYPWVEEDIGDAEVGSVNIIAALKHRDRVRQIHITNGVGYLWENFFTAIQGPFPALRSLSFHSLGETFTFPDTFLNGSAPCLQDLTLREISFPSLPRLLLSTSDLTSLRLFNIPNSGYISPLTMATSLSALPRLESVFINFKSPTSHPKRINRPVPPPTRFVLPALTDLQFKGTTEYLEVLAAQIDPPLLNRITITFLYQHVFDIPQTIRFFSHLKWPTSRSSNLALKFYPPHHASILFSSNTVPHSMCPRSWKVIGHWLDWQLSSVAYICSQILPFRSSVESLSIQCL
jgi:hypothetical protein